MREKFFVAVSDRIPKKGEDFICHRFSKKENQQITCIIQKVIFVFGFRQSKGVYVFIDNEGRVFFLQVLS